MLHDVRVLEISAPETMLAGQILGDLGADVITIEPPAGAAGRRIEPFLDGVPGLERSLTWLALNRNKKAVTLDLNSHDGRDVFRALVERADIVIEAEGGASIKDLLPGQVIHCPIASFSRGGPKAQYRATDLVVMAASGAPTLAGDPDRPPLFFPIAQAMMEAGAEAAVAALAALSARDRKGVSQSAEVTARVAALLGALGQAVAGSSGDRVPSRDDRATRRIPSVYACRDGFMLISVSLNPALAHLAKGLAEWVVELGHFPRNLVEIEWSGLDALLDSGALPASFPDDLVSAVAKACETRTKAELMAVAHARGFMAAPVNTMADIGSFEQFHERGLFAQTTIQGDGREILVPLRFAQFSDYSMELRHPAPLLSQHTSEVFGEWIGLSRTEVQALFVHGVI